MNVTEGRNISLVCPVAPDSQSDPTWQREGDKVSESETRILDKEGRRLIILEAKTSDAGNYTCLSVQGSDKTSHIINLNVIVTVKVEMQLKVLNWTYTDELNNKSSQYYKNFTDNFKAQMDVLYKNFPGYLGIEILNITKGSVKVKFRVTVVVIVKKPTESSVKVKVKVGKKIIVEAKTGLVGNLKVDSSPENLQIDSPLPAPGLPEVGKVQSDKVFLEWSHPDDAKYYGDVQAYVIKFWKFGSGKDSVLKEIGKVTSYRLVDLTSDMRYSLKIAGKNNKNGEGLFTDTVNFKTEAADSSGLTVVLVLVLVGLALGGIVCVAAVILRRRHQRKRQNKRCGKDSELVCNNEMKMDEIAEWPNNLEVLSFSNTAYKGGLQTSIEVPRDHITLLQELGAGAFGIVYKAQLEKEEGHVVTCAVKTLKDGALEEDHRDLMNEVEIMTTVGYHPNLINLIGTCIHDGPLYVILDFAVHGQLLQYLKQRKTEHHINQNAPSWMGDNEKFGIARDVAAGMEHLAKHKCLHRDLSARNILLGEKYVAKIADFGLSRDIYERGIYERKTGNKLPVRWMALEAIETLVFAAETDVWSFGVLLWEIETGGLNPYAGMSVSDLIKYLKSGNRLEQPIGCSSEMYRIMQDCWSAAPHHRPNFGQLHSRLEVLLNTAQVQS